MAFSPDGKTLAVSGGDECIRLWDPASGKQVQSFRRHQKWAGALVYLPDGKTLASATLDASVEMWDVETGKETWDSEVQK